MRANAWIGRAILIALTRVFRDRFTLLLLTYVSILFRTNIAVFLFSKIFVCFWLLGFFGLKFRYDLVWN